MYRSRELQEFMLQKARQLTEDWYDSLDKSDPTGVYSNTDPQAVQVLKEQNYEFHIQFCRLFVQEEPAFLKEMEKWVLKVASDEQHLVTPVHFIVREFFRTRDQYLTFIQDFAQDNHERCSQDTIQMWNQQITVAIDKIVIWYMEKYHEFASKRLQSQQEMINEISSPVISLSQNVALLPLVGDIDTTRAKYILEQTLEQCHEKNVNQLLIDLSGVVVVDTMVAQQLFQLVEALGLIGVKTSLSGIRPEIAQTAVQLGINFDQISISANLSSTIHAAIL
ncbi:STAS domain-containing protein [Domibacillus robiginosus]|uniref:STAS domain-containing protein n=1 Tax=Domibacillus robiginosus TaxID=1071054 RepID=UPI00067AA610|nr:STAS domain-containing protein [Domibacillus robiginosus]